MALRKHALKRTVATLTLMTILSMGLPVNAQLGDSLLKRGTSNNDVKVLQQHLKDLGYMDYNGTTTYYGYITENAVKDFQRANGLKVDGYFGSNTSKALLSKVNGTSSSSNNSSNNSSNSNSSSLFTYTRVLKYGSRGSDVSSLQSALKSLGHYSSSIDGIYGSGTKSAVMNFQRAQNIGVDGYFGSNSYSHLKSAINGNSKPAPSTPAPSEKPSTSSGLLRYNGVLKYGSRGSSVSSLQSALKKLNYYSSSIDGIYGSGTKSAVMNFQRAAHISVDGYAGANTIKHINKALNGDLPNRGGSSDSNTSSRDELTQNIINEAKRHLGTPYKTAGTTPRGFDCTGYTQYVYKKFGINLSRSSRDQANDGSRVSRSQLKPGDLVIFSGTYRPGPSHAGIYLGNDMFISSSSSKGVSIASLNNSYWSKHYSYGRRVY